MNQLNSNGKGKIDNGIGLLNEARTANISSMAQGYCSWDVTLMFSICAELEKKWPSSLSTPNGQETTSSIQHYSFLNYIRATLTRTAEALAKLHYKTKSLKAETDRLIFQSRTLSTSSHIYCFCPVSASGSGWHWPCRNKQLTQPSFVRVFSGCIPRGVQGLGSICW